MGSKIRLMCQNPARSEIWSFLQDGGSVINEFRVFHFTWNCPSQAVKKLSRVHSSRDVLRVVLVDSWRSDASWRDRLLALALAGKVLLGGSEESR